MLRKIIMLVVAPLAIIAGVAAPAFASNTPYTVQVSVNSAISLVGLENVNFPAVTNNGVGVIGCPVTPGCVTTGTQITENYNVSNNDPAGYTLSESAGTSAFINSAAPGNTIPDSDWAIQFEDITVGGATNSTFSPTVAGQQVLHTTSGPSNDNLQETWTMTVPTTQPALASGAYQNTLVYTIVAG